ncbi:hypothetical protein SAMN05660209_01056 [Geodermatophilus africanus]|uniref:DUF4386 family protein n=1 Tax=Geodermatophilus africanus TaxID=1137993 RepID=A0A1H3DN17_9ACTN|nr:hypothetical protein SAMN05660209_01056 [Geodermatophilus africanus]
MTSTTAGTTPAPLPSAPTRLFSLRAAVPLAAVGPVAIGLVRGFLPYDTVDDPTRIVENIMASPGASTAVLWLAYLALLTLPLGVLVAARPAVAARPVLGSVAAALAWLGFLSLFAGAGGDTIAAAAREAGVGVEPTVQLAEAAEALVTSATAGAVFVVGHILGTVLLGVALWRVIPRWAAVALTASQPLHLLFAVFVTNHWADAAAWSLTGVGFAAAALVTLRQATPRSPAPLDTRARTAAAT